MEGLRGFCERHTILGVDIVWEEGIWKSSSSSKDIVAGGDGRQINGVRNSNFVRSVGIGRENDNT